jgi:predicted flap endonuclease-1-like 5' DNA nuclease/uncharacterized protein YbgA (DUF1722 family)
MALADEMRRLTQRLGEDHDGRTTALVGMRTAVARELSEFQTDRQAEAEAQRQRQRVYMRDLEAQVARARGNTTALLAGLGAARKDLSIEQHRKLAEDIVALRQSMGALLAEWNATRRAMAQGQHAQLRAHMDVLAGSVVALQKDVAVLRDGLEVAHQAMANEQQQALAGYMTDVRSQVDQLVSDADQAVAAQHAARQSMAKELCQHLATENQLLQDQAKVFQIQIGLERQFISVDHAEARQVWDGYTKLMQKRGAKRASYLQAPAPPVQEERAEPLTHVAEPVAPEPPAHLVEPTLPEPGAVDDLRAIQGIGPSMERRLHAAGIYRFAQLAALSVEELRRAVAAEPFVKVENWIELARELAERK